MWRIHRPPYLPDITTGTHLTHPRCKCTRTRPAWQGHTSGNLHVCICLYVKHAVCMMYVLTQKYVRIHTFSTYLYFLCNVCMYVCMCIYVFCLTKRYTDRYRQYMHILTIQSIQPIHAIQTDTNIYKHYTHIHSILMNTCKTCKTCVCMYVHVYVCIRMYCVYYVCI